MLAQVLKPLLTQGKTRPWRRWRSSAKATWLVTIGHGNPNDSIRSRGKLGRSATASTRGAGAHSPRPGQSRSLRRSGIEGIMRISRTASWCLCRSLESRGLSGRENLPSWNRRLRSTQKITPLKLRVRQSWSRSCLTILPSPPRRRGARGSVRPT